MFPSLRAASLITWLWSFPISPWAELIDPLNFPLPTRRGQWDINSSKLGRSREGLALWAVPSWHFKSLPTLTRTSRPAKLASEWKTHGWVMPTAPADTEPTARPKGSHSIKNSPCQAAIWLQRSAGCTLNEKHHLINHGILRNNQVFKI